MSGWVRGSGVNEPGVWGRSAHWGVTITEVCALGQDALTQEELRCRGKGPRDEPGAVTVYGVPQPQLAYVSENSLLWGAVLYVVRCLASLPLPDASSNPVPTAVTVKHVSTHCQMCLVGERAKTGLSDNHRFRVWEKKRGLRRGVRQGGSRTCRVPRTGSGPVYNAAEKLNKRKALGGMGSWMSRQKIPWRVKERMRGVRDSDMVANSWRRWHLQGADRAS